jgi:hypothetical protein
MAMLTNTKKKIRAIAIKNNNSKRCNQQYNKTTKLIERKQTERNKKHKLYFATPKSVHNQPRTHAHQEIKKY